MICSRVHNNLLIWGFNSGLCDSQPCALNHSVMLAPGSWFYISVLIECEVWWKHSLRACWATDIEMYLNIYLALTLVLLWYSTEQLGSPLLPLRQITFGLWDPKSKQFYFQYFRIKHKYSFWKCFILTL